jgi:hypothetical protein
VQPQSRKLSSRPLPRCQQVACRKRQLLMADAPARKQQLDGHAAGLLNQNSTQPACYQRFMSVLVMEGTIWRNYTALHAWGARPDCHWEVIVLYCMRALQARFLTLCLQTAHSMMPVMLHCRVLVLHRVCRHSSGQSFAHSSGTNSGFVVVLWLMCPSHCLASPDHSGPPTDRVLCQTVIGYSYS